MGASLRKDGTRSAEVRIRIDLSMAAMARLKRIWRCNTTSFANKFRLYKSLVTSSISMVVKHGPCLLTLKKRTQAFKTKCLRKLLCISCLEHKTSDWVRSKINFLVGPQMSRDRNLHDSEHVTCYDSLSNTILHSTLEGGGTPRKAEEMLDGQQQRVDIPAHATAAHKRLLQKRLQEDLC